MTNFMDTAVQLLFQIFMMLAYDLNWSYFEIVLEIVALNWLASHTMAVFKVFFKKDGNIFWIEQSFVLHTEQTQ
jgi:hypothetical protein